MHDLTEVCFKDSAFLQTFGLSDQNVLDYFAQSQFYDSSCINEQLKMQARFNNLHAAKLDQTQMVGVEYGLDYCTVIPSYFVIRKSQRSSPTKAIYYIVEGTVYQAPTLSKILNNRVLTSLHFVNKAFDIARSDSRFSPSKGYHWKSDEIAMKQAREDVAKKTRIENDTSVDDRNRAMKLQYQLDQLLMSTFEEPINASHVVEGVESKISDESVSSNKGTILKRKKKDIDLNIKRQK